MSYKNNDKYKNQVKYEQTHCKTMLKKETRNKIDKLQKNRESFNDILELLYEFYMKYRSKDRDLNYEVKK
jgi:hypothetical protein